MNSAGRPDHNGLWGSSKGGGGGGGAGIGGNSTCRSGTHTIKMRKEIKQNMIRFFCGMDRKTEVRS
jgi:hypothetical protein